MQTLIFSQGAGCLRGRQLGKKAVNGFVHAIDLGRQANCFQGQVEGDGTKANLVFLRGQEHGCPGGSGAGGKIGEIAGSVSMVVWEGDAGCQMQAGGFEAVEKLLWAGDAAEGGYWAIDRRNFHLAAQMPDLAGPAPCLQFRFQLEIVGGNRNDRGAANGFARLAEVAGEEKTIMPVVTVEEQNVGVAVKLAVL